MHLTLYPIILISTLLLIYFLGDINWRRTTKTVTSPTIRRNPTIAYQVYLRNKENMMLKVFENDNIGVVGYEIYSKYVQAMDAVDILVKNNITNELLMIVKDDSTECSFCVDHPEAGYIGMLPFEVVGHVK